LMPRRSPFALPACLRAKATWLPRIARSRLRTASSGMSPFSKTKTGRSGSAAALAATMRPSTASSRTSDATSHLQDVDGAGGRVGADPAAGVLGQRQPRAADLTVAAPPLQLPGELHHLGRTSGADRVAAGEQAAARVDRELAAQPRDPVAHQAPGLAGRAQADLLVEVQLGHRGGVVQLDDVQVLPARSGLSGGA